MHTRAIEIFDKELRLSVSEEALGIEQVLDLLLLVLVLLNLLFSFLDLSFDQVDRHQFEVGLAEEPLQEPVRVAFVLVQNLL